MILLTDSTIIILPADQPDRIKSSSAGWGRLAIHYDKAQGILRVVGSSELDGKISVSISLGYLEVNSGGVWCRAKKILHDLYGWLERTGYPLGAAAFRKSLDAEPGPLAGTAGTFVVTHCPQGSPEWAGWLLTEGQVIPLEVDVLHPPEADPLRLLEPKWPVRDLTGEVVIVGAGSIGSATALALGMYGVRQITLVDDDRLRWHNLVRHQCIRNYVGYYKVDAVSEAIRLRWPAIKVRALRKNVITDANLMRPLFRRCSLIICAADGVAPRRVVSHLARKARKTAVLACVLSDGAFGEIIRLRPWPGSGCLLCQRAHLISNGQMDPEPTLDSGYGTGTSHRPMTAVGTDLVIVGQLAAKVAVATLLEEVGHYDQRIVPNWAVIGLRTDLELLDPFKLSPGEVRWLPDVRSLPDCPTCGEP